MKILLMLICLWQEFTEKWFSDDEPYEDWMDPVAWQITRI